MQYQQLNGISYSQISNWMKCRKAWQFSYQEKLVPRVTNRPMFLGSAAHLSLTELIMGNDHTKACYEALAEILEKGDFSLDEAAEQTEIVALGIRIGERSYTDIMQEPWETVYMGVENPVALCEHRLFMSIPGWKDPAHGTPDWVARHRDSGQVMVWDFKNRKAMQPEWAEDVDIQLAFYQKLLQENGIVTDGAIKYQAKSTIPRIPALTKKGTMSKANILTTWDIYQEELEKHGLVPGDYADMRVKLEGREWFRQTPVYRSSAEVNRVFEQIIVPAALDIASPTVYPSMGYMNCRTCSYRELCVEEMKGGDTDFLRATEFRVRGEKEPELHTIEMIDEDEDETVQA